VSKNPAVPYVVPFVVFMALMALQSTLALSGLADQLLRLAILVPVLWFIGRPAIDLRVSNWFGTLAIGFVIFVIWILPDMLFPGYRHSILFENSILGSPGNVLSEAERSDYFVLALRALRAIIIVPIVEELFWRGWLMRWLIKPEFQEVPLGTYTASSFWITAALFAAEHGSYWDVGLIAGILFNWWMLRTKSLGHLILSHAMANACLSAYVIAAGKWEYWP
jgi:uncharacterized protein